MCPWLSPQSLRIHYVRLLHHLLAACIDKCLMRPFRVKESSRDVGFQQPFRIQFTVMCSTVLAVKKTAMMIILA